MGIYKNLYTQGYRQRPDGSIKAPRNRGEKGAGVYYNIFGIRELDELFSKLKQSQQKSFMIAAFRKAAAPIVAEAKSNLLERSKAKASGNLYRSIGTKPHRRLPILKIGARTSGNWAGYHGHLIDDGTVERMYIHKKSGKEHKTGAVAANNFWNDAIRGNEQKVIDSVREQMVREFVMRTVKAQAKSKTAW